jgi:DNA-binding response OmpR family regulator
MSLVDGFAVLRHLASSANPIPVLAMSTDPHSLSTARTLGARAVSHKPFALAELLEVMAVHYILDKHSGPP